MCSDAIANVILQRLIMIPTMAVYLSHVWLKASAGWLLFGRTGKYEARAANVRMMVIAYRPQGPFEEMGPWNCKRATHAGVFGWQILRLHEAPKATRLTASSGASRPYCHPSRPV